MSPKREIQNLEGGKSIIGERQASSSNAQQVEKSIIFSKTEKISWDDIPNDVVEKIFNYDLCLDSNASLGWSQNDISAFLSKEELPAGLSKESFIKLIRSAKILA